MALGDKLKGKGQESSESYKNKFKEKLDDNLNNETTDPNLDMGYIEGYDKPSYVDRLIQNSDRIQGAKDKINDRLGTEKKLNEGAGVRTKDMPLWEDDEFLFGLENGDIDHFLEDPTYLGFKLSIIEEDSPLFNYGLGNSDLSSMNNSALDFFKKYIDIPAVAERAPMYQEFKDNIYKIFNVIGEDKVATKQFYISSILGLADLNKKMVDYEKSLIKVTFTEDVVLRMMYITELYNNMTYSYRDGKYIVPDNCLRFDLDIKIADIRKFKMLKDVDITDTQGNTYTERLNTVNVEEEPHLRYRLYDCNFDFSETQPFQDGITIGGFGVGAQTSHSEVTVSIRYKSVERIYKSPMLHNSTIIKSKKAQVMTFNSDGLDFEEYEKVKVPKKTEKGILQNIGENALDDVIDKGFQELRKARGNMVNKLQEEIRGAVNIPTIYPDNVYAEDFNDLSLEGFARGLGTDAFNEANDALGDGLNTIGGF